MKCGPSSVHVDHLFKCRQNNPARSWTLNNMVVASPHPSPPPPYETPPGSSNENETRQVETIPKMTQVDESTLGENVFQVEVMNANKQSHSNDDKSQRKSSNAANNKKLLNTLASPRKLLSHMTIEPLAFLAIMTLYIEFPSIQDLIYTKICLQVIASHPNLTSIRYQTDLKTSPAISSLNSSRESIELTLPAIVEDRKLSSSGRIQSNLSDSVIKAPEQHLELAQKLTTDKVHLLCDRMNKTAVPVEIRKEITVGNSLFWLKYQLIICSLCAISSPYWGGMSDRIGRFVPLNVPIFFSVISNCIALGFGILINLNSHNSFRAEWLYLAAVLVGISGGQAGIIVNSFSFIGDLTSSESRSKRVVILESVIFLSHSVGFYISKHIMSLGLASPDRVWFNRHFVAFTSCVVLNLICLLYSFLRLRHHCFHRFLNSFEREQQEAFAGDMLSGSNASFATSGSLSRPAEPISSIRATQDPNVSDRMRELTSSSPDDLDGPLARSDRSWTSWTIVFTFKYYGQTYETLTKRRESRTIIQLLLLCGFISAMSLTSIMLLLYIYLHSDPFNWSTSQYSSWNSISSITRGLALVGLSCGMKFSKSWNVPDPIVAALGFLSRGVGLLIIGSAANTTLVNWALMAFVFSEFSMPPIRSLLSKMVVKEELAKIYSSLAALQSICFLIGNTIFYLAYSPSETQNFFRLSFLIVAGFQFAALVIMLVIYSTFKYRMVMM